jgi:predicted amidophosphoribosyltransferase
MDDLERLVQRQNSIRCCKQCNVKMSYTSVTGTYTCPNCGGEEKDTYGKMKDLLKDRPTLTKGQMSAILGVPLREINKYIKDGVLDNPNRNFKA